VNSSTRGAVHLGALIAFGCGSSNEVVGTPSDAGTERDIVRLDAPTLDTQPTDSQTEPSMDAPMMDSVDLPREADGPLTASSCLIRGFVHPLDIGPDYDQFMPVVGSHCLGTNHQAIDRIERVVFLGDSVTVGSPPTGMGDYYRVRLANALADRFGLARPDVLWQTVNIFNGRTFVQQSGAFASCAEWGANARDLPGAGQLAECFPDGMRDQRTLVIITIGGNDVGNIHERGTNDESVTTLWDATRAFVQQLRDTASWLVEPGRFPNGGFVVFGNMYEFTDATADTASCPAAAATGMSGTWDDPIALRDMVVWANEEYMRIATDTRTDMIFMLEHFCGHGFHHDDPAAPCYRGPGTARWFDDTCIHPNPTGHGVIADMFSAVVAE